ncbi:hypothetical protein KR038_003705, partial [Drosophila bunnanda]
FSENKKLLDALLCEIYGRQEQLAQSRQHSSQDPQSSKKLKGQLASMVSGMVGDRSSLERLNVRKLIDVCAILKVEILMIGYLLEKVLIARDRLQRHQEVLCEFVTAVLVVESDDAQPKMRFSLSPPPQKAIASSSSTRLTSPTIATATRSITARSTTLGPSTTSPGSNNRSPSPRAFGSMLARNGGGHEVSPSATSSGSGSASAAADEEAASDYNQWLHAMKLVARLPGGTPPEFRRKLWLSLADKYLKSKNVDWAQQREKCFCEEWREDDEELGIQIVKDLHRTGSNLCTGPAGSINQAKLKRILLGYARYNPEVGYCQGFNMLGALILQVMDKEEEESMKVMIYLVEGVLPTGYFYGSMGGLQADMGVFRELMQTRLPRLAKHLQRLQGPVENAFEPPLTNVFTMQWFLTMFCTCLPMSCVLRVWDLVLIEGSDVLLRTALVLWSLLEERVLSVRSADEFYGKMGSYSSELLNGHLVDSNGLIERVVKLGPIADLRQLRDKHLYNIAPLRHKQGLQLYYDDEDTHSDEERMAVATVWGLNWGRRGSVGPAAAGKQPAEQKDRLALDISLLKKQYDRLRERQKQAHVILTTACSTAARQGSGPGNSSQPAVPVNQLLLGRPAIVTNKGKRVGAPLGAIPPARKPSLPAVLHTKPAAEKQLRRGETLLWRDTDPSRRRRDSLTWKEIKADRAAMMREGVDVSSMKTQKLRTRFGKSDSSSYSEDSDGEQEAGGGSGGGGSSTDTSLCDDDDPKSMEKSPKNKAKLARKLKEQKQLSSSREASLERQRPKSWAPSSQEIPFILMGTDSGDEKDPPVKEDIDIAEDSATECDRFPYEKALNFVNFKLEPLDIQSATEGIELPEIPGLTPISPIPTTKEMGAAEEDLLEEQKPFDVSDSGVTNQYFERVNSVERPNKLELSYSLNEEESETSVAYLEQREKVEGHSADGDYQALPPLPVNPEDDPLPGAGKVPQIRDDNIPGENKDDYKELLSMTIEERVEYKPPPPTASSLSSAARKRRDPRRKTLTRSSTIEIEERYQALERRISQEQPTVERSSKYIPSTAALEERFNTLEKQLSAEKQRKELVEMDADQPEKFERIPSTADLETRFNALAKQMSSSESTAKSPIDFKDEEQPSGSSSSKEQKDSEKTSKLHNSEDIESERQEKSSAKSETSESKEKPTEDRKAEQPRLKKLPSTAELEDRFNALERKMSVQKSSPVKTKKEPPDEESNDQETKPEESEKAALKEHKGNREESEEKALSPTEETASRSKSKPVEPPKQPEKSVKESSDVKTDTKQSETLSTKKEAVEEDVPPKVEVKKKIDSGKVDPGESPKKTDPKKVETQKKIESKLEESAKKTESENLKTTKKTDSETKPPAKESKQEEPAKTPRKSPPSTEELEKRFNALEKQLSTTNLEPTKQAEPAKSTQKSKEVQLDEKAQKSMKSFDDKIKEVNTALVKDQKKVEQKDPVEKKPKTSEKIVKQPDESEPEQSHQSDLSKRRASEPPSTEDLEKRYETLKRRMSSKNHFSTPNETVNEALERIEQEVISESVEEEKKPPPSTEDLEIRFEALQGGEKKPKAQTQPKHVDVAIEAHIPEPPPPPPPPKELPTLSEPVLHQQQALIEELQRKMRGQSPGDENLKPSEINPERRQRKLLQRPTPMGDETSEAPANTAYYRAANPEQWQQRMVRRFSDLPSRADLENRLQFLERQLYKKFYKQRCASDSEVASKVMHSPSPDELPTTSRQARVVADGLLEQRVLALEKQLSENSLKLLEAIRDREANAAAPQSDDSGGSPRRLSTDTIDATGKELVRYTQNIGELEEVDAHKPINISINIKMLLNKDRSEPKQPKAESKPTTEDLTRRLELLEQQLLEERAKNGSFIPETEVLQPEESEACKKQEKNCHNQHVKSDETQKGDEPVKDQIKPETAKETKTLENEEKAQARAKEVVTEKSTNLEKPKMDEKTAKEEKAELPINDKKEEVTKKEDKVHSSETKPKPAKEENPLKENSKPKEASSKENKKEVPKTEETQSKESTSSNKKQDNPMAETIKAKETASVSKESIQQLPEKTKETTNDPSSPKEVPDKMVINATDLGPMDPNNKTVVLLMDNEPRASRVRRLTRANTEELEGLFQALEKQLSDRNLIKSEDGRLIRADSKPSAEQAEQVQAISDLTKEIEDFTSGKPDEKEKPEEAVKGDKPEPEEPEEDYDWGPNPVKHHLKRKTAYLPSTKELEARFRSLERQIKLLEDVEKIDVEQRLVEIERKIKLQYSLSHEKDLNKYLELCEGRGLDDEETLPEEPAAKEEETARTRDRSRSPGRKVATKSPYTSPSRKVATKSPYTSPSRKSATKSPYTSPSRQREKTPYSSPTRSPERKSKRSPYTSPARRKPHPNDLPISDDLEYKYRVLDLVRSKSKENLAKRMNDPNRKRPIHPLEILLDPSPDDSAIPSTGELEHRIRVLDGKLKSPAKVRPKPRSRSPTIEDMKRQKMREEQKPRTPVHNLERLVSSPGRPEPPTAEELEERMRILEQEHTFDFKTQKDYRAFNQKLKDVISPSLSFEEFRAAKSREQSPRRHGATTPKSALRRDDYDEATSNTTTTYYRPTSPKVIRFQDEDEDHFEEAPRPKSRQTSDRMVGRTNDALDCLTENAKILQRILKKTLADQPSATRSYASSSEGLDALGSRLMRETSPITRTGTHTGVPLRTGENINDRLSSIKNSIKSIDNLCEEKPPPYQKEKCQRYIDSLFSDSLHFASKKSSLEDLSLSRSLSRSESRGRSIHRASGDYAPSIRITSEHRSLGSAESRRSPLGSSARDTSPLHYRSHRDMSRDLSPRRRRLGEQEEEEERERREREPERERDRERESSRVRRDNLLPNYSADNRSELSSGSSLTGFNHKVDRQLEETCAKYADDARRSACRTPLSHPYESRSTATRHQQHHTDPVQDSFPRPVSPYRQPYEPRGPAGATSSSAPVYQPGKLEIRHTTVTSTFYDRFLTEKQIERTHSRPNSRSPVASPSVPARSYGEFSTTSAPSCTTATATASLMSSSYAGTSFSLPTSSNYPYSRVTSSSDLRSATTATTTSASSTSATTSSYVPYNFSSSFTSRLSDPIATCSASTSSLTTSTGVYNPMMSFTLREPLASSSLGAASASPLAPFQFNRTFVSNFDKEQEKK